MRWSITSQIRPKERHPCCRWTKRLSAQWAMCNGQCAMGNAWLKPTTEYTETAGAGTGRHRTPFGVLPCPRKRLPCLPWLKPTTPVCAYARAGMRTGPAPLPTAHCRFAGALWRPLGARAGRFRRGVSRAKPWPNFLLPPSSFLLFLPSPSSFFSLRLPPFSPFAFLLFLPSPSSFFSLRLPPFSPFAFLLFPL